MCPAIVAILPPMQHGGDVTTLEDLRGLLPEGTAEAWPKVAAALPTGTVFMGGTALAVWLRHRRSEDLETVRTFLGHLGDFRYLDDDPAMHATFGVDVRQVVMVHFQRRVPQVTASFSRQFAEAPPAAISPADTGDSIRLTQATAGKGVTPLTN